MESGVTVTFPLLREGKRVDVECRVESGVKVVVAAAVAAELGVTDIGGRRPRPLGVLRPPETSLPAQRELH
jgi:hypothetical protein